MNKDCSLILTCKEEKSFVFEKNGYPILDYKKFGHRFMDSKNPENHLSKVYSDDYFFRAAKGIRIISTKKKILLRAGLRYAKLISK